MFKRVVSVLAASVLLISSSSLEKSKLAASEKKVTIDSLNLFSFITASNKNNKSTTIKWQTDNSANFFKDKASGGLDVRFIDRLGKVDLKKYLTRNDFAKLLWELYFKQKKSNLVSNPFKVVKANDKFAKYILAAKNYIPYYKEKDGNYFEGNEQITRESVIATLMRIWGSKLDSNKLISEYRFSDKNDISKGLVYYIIMGLENKWIDIKSYDYNNYFCPKAPVTLGDLSKLLQNVYEIINPGKYKSIYGNSIDNICGSFGRGLASQSGNKIFISNSYLGNGLYEANEDGTDFKKLVNGSAECINCDGDWIYFIWKGSKICKIKNDGTMEKVIYSRDAKKYLNANISNMIRIKDKLYFLENLAASLNDQNLPNSLVSINLDGSGRKIVAKDAGSGSYILLNGYIYYINPVLNRFKIGGTSTEKVSDEFKELKNAGISNLCSAGGNLIVSTDGYNNKTYKSTKCIYAIDMNKHILSKVGIENNASSIQLVGNKLYYCCNGCIFTMDPISNKARKLIDDNVCVFNIVGDWIYYEKEFPNENYAEKSELPYYYELWRVKLDGTKRQSLITDYAESDDSDINIVNDADEAYISKKVKSFSKNLTMPSFN